MKYLYLAVEVSVRDLDSRLLLALFALKQGYTTIVGEDHFFTRNLSNLPAGVFFDKSFTKNHWKKHFQAAKKSGCNIVGIDEEGGNSLEGISGHWKRYFQNSMKVVSRVFTWGQFQHNKVVGIHPKFASKVVKTGSQRWDLLRPEGVNFYSDKAGRIRAEYGDFILVNLNAVVDRTGRIPLCKYELHSLDALFGLVHGLSDKCPGTKIVLRPHPKEVVKDLADKFKDCPNVVLRNDDVVEIWALASKLTVVTGCTTGIQAYLMNSPVVSYALPSFQESFLTNLLCPTVQTVEEIADRFERSRAGDLSWFTRGRENRLQLARQHFEALDGPFACQNMLAQINKVAVGGKKLKLEKLNLKSAISPKFPDPGFPEVQRRLERLRDCYSLNVDFRASQIRSRVYLIEGV